MEELKQFAREKGMSPVKRFTVLHPGWECDQYGLVAIDKVGKHHVILTNHGSPYLADKTEVSKQVEKLQAWLRDAQEAERLISSK